MNLRTASLTLFVAVLAVFAGCAGDLDPDGDGLDNSVEQEAGLDPSEADTDGDGLSDKKEYQSDVLDGTTNDTDGDGLNDTAELRFGSNPSRIDTDGDDLIDPREKQYGSNPKVKDSDGDGLPDGVEVQNSASPTDVDTDDDGLNDSQEVRIWDTLPDVPDTDSDGLADEREVGLGANPKQEDTDGDGADDGTEANLETNLTRDDTDNDGLQDGREVRIGTDPLSQDSDGDNRTDLVEANDPRLDPTAAEVQVKQSPEAGWQNQTIQREARKSVEFIAELPRDQSDRERVVVGTATRICDAHNQVVPEAAANATDGASAAQRNTYRVQHAAKALHEGMGADIDVNRVDRKMRTAREYGGMASKYTPLFGSYQRLHNASCAVKRGEPGAKEDFYIASTEFAVDLVLLKEGIVYKAAFKTTGVAARTVGVNRMA